MTTPEHLLTGADMAENSFEAACYDETELRDLVGVTMDDADEIDMAAWDLTATEWFNAIVRARAALENDPWRA